jgi:hypothetical protein
VAVTEEAAKKLFASAKQKEFDLRMRISKLGKKKLYDFDDIDLNLSRVKGLKKSVENNFTKKDFGCAKIIIAEINRRLNIAGSFLEDIERKAANADK